MLEDNKKQFLSVSELSTFLNISKITVYRLVETRKIVFYKIGGSIRFNKKDVLDYLEASKINII
jgi:excisionase family DNA binding protein